MKNHYWTFFKASLSTFHMESLLNIPSSCVVSITCTLQWFVLLFNTIALVSHTSLIYTFLKSCRWFVDDIITVFKMLNMISDSYYLIFFIIIKFSFILFLVFSVFCNYFLNQFLIIRISHNNIWSYPSRAVFSIIID